MGGLDFLQGQTMNVPYPFLQCTPTSALHHTTYFTRRKSSFVVKTHYVAARGVATQTHGHTETCVYLIKLKKKTLNERKQKTKLK